MTQAAEDSRSTIPVHAPSEGPSEGPGEGSKASAVILTGRVGAAVDPALAEPAEPPWGLAFYLFVEPFTMGKVVLDLSAGGGPGAEMLRKAGAVEVLFPARLGLPLPFPAGGADLAICALTAAEVADDRQRAALFAEIHRVLRRDGMCVVRALATALESAAVGVSLRAVLADMALEYFATVDIVEETPFRAVSYFIPGSEDLAVSEAMSKVGGKPSHLIALCTSAAERTWHLSESLLVPTGPGDGGEAGEGELAAWRAEVERLTATNAAIACERDDLRERQMMLQDRAERLGQTVAAMRKDVERYLRQIGDDAAARELLTLERDQLRRKIATAEGDIEAANREIDKQKSSVQALRKEVARLRAARGSSAGSGHGPT
jgi:SAM-dependent methyltransferase/regulator of replication initiation timing